MDHTEAPNEDADSPTRRAPARAYATISHGLTSDQAGTAKAGESPSTARESTVATTDDDYDRDELRRREVAEDHLDGEQRAGDRRVEGGGDAGRGAASDQGPHAARREVCSS